MSNATYDTVHFRLNRAGVAKRLWQLTLFFAVADIVLTWHGLNIGLPESNPLALTLLAEHGFGSLVALKAAVLFASYGFAKVLPVVCRGVVPACLVLVWGIATAINTYWLAVVHTL